MLEISLMALTTLSENNGDPILYHFHTVVSLYYTVAICVIKVVVAATHVLIHLC